MLTFFAYILVRVLIQDDHVNPEWTLLDYLRNKLRLCGTKSGCGDGNCGACTVMVSRYNRKQDKEIHIPVIACFAPICSMHGLAVTTIEGIGSTKTKLHPIQEKIAEAHGSLCGFCSPGFVMSMYTLLRNSPKPTVKEIEESFQGNLCRCAGYRPILEGYKMPCPKANECCRLQARAQKFDSNDTQLGENSFIPCHPSQQPIFPPDLKMNDSYENEYLKIEGPITTWYRPTTLDELLDLKSKFPYAQIMVGNTELGLDSKFKNKKYPILIHPSHIKEMTEITETLTGVRIGASTTVAQVEQFLRSQIVKHSEEKTRIFKAVLEIFFCFGSKQVRNVGTIVGNIVSGSPVADSLPILTAIKAKLEVISKNTSLREVVIDENYFIGYRKSVVKPDETILAIHLPFTDKNHYCLAYKQARNKENDISIVHTAILVKFKDNSIVIEDISFGFGGLSYKVVTAPKTQKELLGLEWNRSMLEKACHYLLEDRALAPKTPGGKIRYRNSLILSLFLKMFLSISQKLKDFQLEPIDGRLLSAVHDLPVKKYKSPQFYSVNAFSGCLKSCDMKPRSEVSVDAQMQASGEITYCDDMPYFENELYVSFVLSTRSHATIKNIDTADALQVTGVIGLVSADDVTNKTCTCYSYGNIFVSDKVTSQGQIICGIVASDKFSAQEAAKKIKIDYEDLETTIITIEDAFRNSSVFGMVEATKGDVYDQLKVAPHTISNECSIGGQKHLYFESHCGIIVPSGEGNEDVTVYVSSETPEDIEINLSKLLGIPQGNVKVDVKKLGGGYGGKGRYATWFVLAAAVAAKKFNRPVRYVVDHYDDIVINGGRHPFTFQYKVRFNDVGQILACDVEARCNVGHIKGFGFEIVEKVLVHLQNALDFPCFKAASYGCKTNLPAFTSFRGLGGPQAVYIANCLTDEIASYLGIDVLEVIHLNICQDEYLTQCFQECVRLSNFCERRNAVEEFNRNNRYKKRGISVVPVKYATNMTVTSEKKEKSRSFTYWAGCSEIEIDTLTGDHQLMTTDIVINLGKDTCSKLDLTQLEGAFIQGYGLFVLEECVYSASGTLVTRGPATYKIPLFRDMPEKFNVYILQESSNDPGVLVQQDIDEPALTLASSVFFAIKNAVRAARTESAVETALKLDPPATVERVRLACEDDIIKMVEKINPTI